METDLLLRSMLDALDGRVMTLDRDLRVLYANQTMLGFFDMEASEMVGALASDFAEPEVIAAIAPLVARCFDGVPSHLEEWTHHQGSRRRFRRRSIMPCRDQRGEVVAALLISRDIDQPEDMPPAVAPRSAGQVDQPMLQAIIDAMPARAAVVDRQHRYVTVNKLLLDYVRLPMDQVLGRTVAEVLGEASFEVMRAWEPRLLAGQTVRYEGWVPYIHGEQRYVRQSVMPHHGPDGEVEVFISMSEDLTALRRREADVTEQRAAVVAAEARAAAIVTSALDGIIVIDEEGLVVEFNPAAEAIFGQARGAVMGQPIGQIIVPHHLRAAHDHGFKRYLKTGEAHVLGKRIEIDALHADGHVFPIELALVEVRLAGRRLFAAHLRDLSEPKRALAEIAAQRERIHQIEKLSAMGSLLAGVAHELNNPLAILLAQATLLKEKAPDAAVHKRAERIEAAAERSGRIVKSFLAMARQKPPERGAMRLNEVARGALEMTGYGLRSNGVQLEEALDPALPEIEADRDLIGQVVANLLINAQQALQECEHPRRIRIATRREGSMVALEISDNGPGVPAAVLERIFDPYFTTKPVGVGTGIGLAICRKVVEEHGGTITVGRGLLGGALFRVLLPIGNLPDTAEGAAHARTASMCVLVVDDETDVAESLAEILESDSHFPRIVASGEEAMALLRETHFDALFSDLRMPGMDGMALRAEATALRPELAPRFVIMTGDTVAGPRAMERDGPPPLVLEKPFTPAEVRAMMRRLAELG